MADPVEAPDRVDTRTTGRNHPSRPAAGFLEGPWRDVDPVAVAALARGVIGP